MSRLSVLASLLLAACSSAYSDGRAPAAPMMVAGDPAVAATAAPYGVEILGDDGRSLATYTQGGRYYVLGDAGDRYIIHVTNPTDRRVEAVVSVDGLDVIDGEPGDLAKRGYVVPPHGDLDIEGFRTSTSDVATFRFSSVAASYAGRKGKARNVGVIAVALFDEAAPQEIILEQEPPPADPPPVVYYDENTVRGYDGAGGGDIKADKDEVAPRSGGYRGHTGGGEAKGAVAPESIDTESPVMRPPPPDYPDDYREPPPSPPKDPECCNKEKRGGLGTEYGEQRYSAATWTRFVRASDTPTAIAELRYNDAAGLAALGIDIAPPADPEEITKRETADPFPGDPSFSHAP